MRVCDVRKKRRGRAKERCIQVYADKFGQAGYYKGV
jgi:hypothetical protein